MKYKVIFSILFGLYVIWTGLWRNIEASAYKPNALWFCLVLGVVSIAAAFLYQVGKDRVAFVTALLSALFVFGFYFKEFVSAPEKEATFRVGLIILASIAQITVTFFPKPISPPRG